VDERPDAIDEDYISSEILGLYRLLLGTQKVALKQYLNLITLHLAHFLFQTMLPLSAIYKRHPSSLLMIKQETLGLWNSQSHPIQPRANQAIQVYRVKHGIYQLQL
jgi:hypothetical protein